MFEERFYEKPSDSFVQSLAKGLTVIESFNQGPPLQTLSQVAHNTGLTPAGARRLLLTLVKMGFVRTQDRFFCLTPKILSLGLGYLNSMPFWQRGQPHLERLVEETGESCSVAVLEDCNIMYVMCAHAKKLISANINLGNRLPAHCTSMGRVLLAWEPENVCMDILARSVSPQTPMTITDLETLGGILKKVRQQGWCLVNREMEDRVVSLAAPILDSRGVCSTAVAITGFARQNAEMVYLENFLPKLLQITSQFSQMML